MSGHGSYPELPSARYLAVGFKDHPVPDLQRETATGIVTSMLKAGVHFDDPVRGTTAAVVGAVTAVREFLLATLAAAPKTPAGEAALARWLETELAIVTTVPAERA